MIIAKKKYYPFAFENTQNLVIFSMKVIVVERELLVSVNLSKSSSENLPTGNFLGSPRGKFFLPHCSIHIRRKFLRNIRILQRRGGIFSWSYRLFWSSKYFTPFRTVMTTSSPRCKPLAINIVELLTFKTGKMALRGKMLLSQSNLSSQPLRVYSQQTITCVGKTKSHE